MSSSQRFAWPRAREPFSGYSHLAGLGLAVAGAVWLAIASRHRLAALVYSACLVSLYAASAAYHLVNLGEVVTRRLRRLDHAAIFLMIAGSATPVLEQALAGTARTVMLGLLWTAAVLGVVFRVLWMNAPRWSYTTAYVALGWLAAARIKDVVHGTPPVALTLFVSGGVAYTLGAIVYAMKWPDPLPERFGFHEVWHLFVLAASCLHFAAIAIIA